MTFNHRFSDLKITNLGRANQQQNSFTIDPHCCLFSLWDEVCFFNLHFLTRLVIFSPQARTWIFFSPFVVVVFNVKCAVLPTFHLSEKMHWFTGASSRKCICFHMAVVTHALCSTNCHTQAQLSSSQHNAHPPLLHGENMPKPASHQKHAQNASWCANCSSYRFSLTIARSRTKSYLDHCITIPSSIFLCLFSIRFEHAKTLPSCQHQFQAL